MTTISSCTKALIPKYVTYTQNHRWGSPSLSCQKFKKLPVNFAWIGFQNGGNVKYGKKVEFGMRMRKKVVSLATALVLVVSMFAGIIPTAPVLASDLNSGLILHYGFNDTAGSTTVADLPGNGNHGTLAEDAVTIAGDKGGAVELDGDMDYVQMPAAMLDDVEDMTVSSWVYLTASGGSSDDPVIWYNFDETSGTTFENAGNLGSSFNAEAAAEIGGTPGRSGNALDCDGTAQFATIPDGLTFEDNITVAAWVYSRDSSLQSMLFCFGAKFWMNQHSAQNGCYTAGMEPAWGQTDGIYNNIVSDTQAIPNKVWTHVAVTFEGTAAKLYKNGELVASKTLLNKPSDYNGSYIGNYIGKSAWSADPPFRGLIDDFRIYNRALSAVEIAAIAGISHDNSNITSIDPVQVYTLAGVKPVLPGTVTARFDDGYSKSVDVVWDTDSITPDKYDTADKTFTVEGTVAGSPVKATATVIVQGAVKDLLLWYKMDEGGGTLVGDASGNGNNGIMIGGEGWTTGRSGNAANLTGSNYIKLPDGIMSGITDFTITAWERQSKVSSWQRLFDFGTGLTHYMYFTLYDGSSLRFAMNKNNSWQEIITAAINDPGTWHHIAISKSGSTVIIYVDGVKYAESDSITYNPSDLGNTTQTYIGKSQYSADANFMGQIDDFRIYSRGLTEAEIQNVIGETVTDEEAVAINKASLDLGDTFAVTENLNLKTQGTIGVSITWESSDPEHVSNTGVIKRPGEGEEAVTVTLTATLKKNAVTDTKVFTVTLLPMGATPYVINIDADRKGVDINPTLYGVFFEDINYSLDGGLYAELVQNRSFEMVRVNGSRASASTAYAKTEPAYTYAWNFVQNGGGTGTMEINTERAIHENNPHFLRLTVTNPGDGVGVYNTGYSNTTETPTPSIQIVQGDRYNFSMFARSSDFTGPIEVSLRSEDGSVVYASAELKGITDEWKKFECVLEPNRTSDTARLQVLVKGTGTVDMDMISLFPQRTWKNRPNGARYDLAKMISDLKPKYFRFPGGCAVQGIDRSNAYRWKLSVGPVEQRKSNYNFWFDSERPYYNQSLGFGFYEYFQFAEDIGATPVPAINCGMSWNTGEVVPLDELEPYIQDAVDLVDFANSIDFENNEWARLRRDMGHPEPFNLKYLEIGNEDYGTNYYERYAMFAERLRKTHPEIKLIIVGGITMGDSINTTTWARLQQGLSDADVVDEHYYTSNSNLYANMNRYDNYDRNAQTVFIGEYASNSTANSITDALAEAAYMTHIEENGDIVELASYAPLLAKQNFTQWTPDLIYFNNQTVFGTVNYYVQKLFMRNFGDYTLPTELVKYGHPGHQVRGAIGLGSYNTAVTYKDVKVVDNDTGEIILSDNFSDVSQWTEKAGTWVVDGDEGTYAQTSTSIINTLTYAGDKKLSNYTLTLKARKDSGDEGFLIYIGLQDPDNYLRWNIGGFSNTRSGFERCVNGVTTQLVPYYDTAKFPTVTSGVWYDIKVVVSGNNVKCYIKAEGDSDYIQVFDIIDRPKTGPVYVVTSKDEDTGDIILKVVNPQSTAQEITVKLNGADYINPVGLRTVLKGSEPSDANSFTNPKKVVPEASKVSGLGSVNKIIFDPYSLTILRIRTSKEDAPELSEVKISASASVVQEGGAIRINIDSSKMSDGSDADMGDAAISYECDHPDLVTFDDDGRVTISNSVGDVTAITLWVSVSLNGTTVKSNEVKVSLEKTAIAEIKDIFVSTIRNKQPDMPSKIYVVDEEGVTKLASVTWEAIPEDRLSDAGATFTVEGVVEGADMQAKAHVLVSDARIMTGMEAVNVSTNLGVKPSLPSKITAYYSDGTSEELDVVWDDIQDGSLGSAGSIKVNGKVYLEKYINPLIEQRADPYIYRHSDGYYYFVATVPDFDKIIIRKAATIQKLATAEEKTIWNAHSTGEMANHIWAPELHYINGRWYIYFAAGSSSDQWAIRPYVLECDGADPTIADNWVEKGKMQAAPADSASFTNFSLDATTFEHNGKRYMVWAQKTTEANTPSNLYIAEMQNPWTLKTAQVLISTPEYSWEKQTYWVNEGPSVIKRNGRIFISYSASATDETYCMGLLTASDTSDLLDASSWSKASEPVMKTNEETSQYGPGHNSFTVAKDGVTDILVYHTRNYPGYIEGKDALTDPNRNTRVQMLRWKDDGTPNFGIPVANGEITVTATVTANVTVKSSDGTLVPVTGVSLDKRSLSLRKGNSAQLTATVEPADATNKNVTWASSNTGVATVSSTGKVTAVGVGTAEITVTTVDGNFTDSCTVTVTSSSSGGRKNKNKDKDNKDSSDEDIDDDEDSGEGTTTPDTPDEPSTGQSRFSDLEGYEWAKEAIEKLAEKGIVKGTSETTFEPGRNITRAEFITLLVRALGLNCEFESNFDDVSPEGYYYEALGIARQLGIAEGTGGNTFDPHAEITREDMIVLVARALEAAGRPLPSGDVSELSRFIDADSISDYAVESVAGLVKEGIVKGSGDAINPRGTATRAEAAVIIYRIIEWLAGY